jgi:hypothetical protein
MVGEPAMFGFPPSASRGSRWLTGRTFDAEITCDCVGTAIHDGGMSTRPGQIRSTGHGRRLYARNSDGAGAVAARGPHARSRHQRCLRRFGLRLGPLRRLVSQPVLVRSRTAGRPPVVPGHSWPDGADRPGDPHRLGEDVLLAQCPRLRGVDRHHPGVCCSRTSLGRMGRRCQERPRPSESSRAASVCTVDLQEI